MSCFWFDILKSVTSGLATGLILALIGWRVWKAQHNYTKRFDVYIKSLANISQIKWVIESIRTPLRQASVETIYQQNKELFEKLERNKFEFGVYFGKDYYKDFDYFSTIMFQLRYHDNNFQKKVLEALSDLNNTTEKLYGSNNPNDEINTKLKESFERIESALKKKVFFYQIKELFQRIKNSLKKKKSGKK